MQPTKEYRQVPSYPIGQGQGNMQQPEPSGSNNTTQVVMTVNNENNFGVPEGEMRGRREGGRRGEEMRETKGMERNGKGKEKNGGGRKDAEEKEGIERERNEIGWNGMK